VARQRPEKMRGGGVPLNKKNGGVRAREKKKKKPSLIENGGTVGLDRETKAIGGKGGNGKGNV